MARSVSGAGVTITLARDLATNVVSGVRVVCRNAGGHDTVLQAAVGAGVDAEAVATALCRQCSVPFIPESDAGR